MSVLYKIIQWFRPMATDFQVMDAADYIIAAFAVIIVVLLIFSPLLEGF